MSGRQGTCMDEHSKGIRLVYSAAELYNEADTKKQSENHRHLFGSGVT